MLYPSPVVGFLHSPLLQELLMRPAVACNDNGVGNPAPAGPEKDDEEAPDDFPAGLLTLY